MCSRMVKQRLRLRSGFFWRTLRRKSRMFPASEPKGTRKQPMNRCACCRGRRDVPSRLKKLRIIRSHMSNLELCKLNLESLILTTAEKYYLPQLGTCYDGAGIHPLPQSASFLRLEWICPCSLPQASMLWATVIRMQNKRECRKKKKTTRISRAGAYIKPLLVQCALCAVMPSSSRKSSNRYMALKKRRGHRKHYLPLPECCSRSSTICSREK